MLTNNIKYPKFTTNTILQCSNTAVKSVFIRLLAVIVHLNSEVQNCP